MPIPPNIRDVFDLVLKATADGRANWKLGPTPEMVFLALDDFSVQLWKQEAPPGIVRVAGMRFPIRFTILDGSGGRVNTFKVEGNDGDWDSLASLFEKATQSIQSAADDKLSKFKRQLAEKLGLELTG